MIGIGNRDRGDDAAGIAVAEHVSGPTTHVVPGGAFDLAELWSVDDNVVIVDAMRSGLPPGTVQSFDVSVTPLPSETFASTHSFGPAAGIELARVLDRLPATIEVIGIEAGDLTTGSNMTPEVALSVERVAKELSDA